jgi:hypothetical protein
MVIPKFTKEEEMLLENISLGDCRYISKKLASSYMLPFCNPPFIEVNINYPDENNCLPVRLTQAGKDYLTLHPSLIEAGY